HRGEQPGAGAPFEQGTARDGTLLRGLRLQRLDDVMHDDLRARWLYTSPWVQEEDRWRRPLRPRHTQQDIKLEGAVSAGWKLGLAGLAWNRRQTVQLSCARPRVRAGGRVEGDDGPGTVRTAVTTAVASGVISYALVTSP